MKKMIPLVAVILIFAACKKESNNIKSLPVTDNNSTEALSTDINGAARDTIKIGSQVWRTINLNLSRYRNGDMIPQVTNINQWKKLITGAWCWYNNDSATYGAIYGKLYNWYAVNDPRGLAPAGWHVPTDAEWTTLTTFLGGVTEAAGKMKSTGTIEAGTGLWYSPNFDATNRSGFTGFPGGARGATLGSGIGRIGFWWSSSQDRDRGAGYAWARDLYYGELNVGRKSDEKRYGFSVRCVRD